MSDRAEATFLGDGLFAHHDGYQIELFAHNGIHKTNSVYLDDRTLANFLQWIEDRKRTQA